MAGIHKDDTSTILDLVACLELERSSMACVQLARVLGYQVTGRPGLVTLTRSGRSTDYTSLDGLYEALRRAARRRVGQ